MLPKWVPNMATPKSGHTVIFFFFARGYIAHWESEMTYYVWFKIGFDWKLVPKFSKYPQALCNGRTKNGLT